MKLPKPIMVAIVAITVTVILFGCSLNLGVVRIIVTPSPLPTLNSITAISEVYMEYTP